ncbi:MAG: SMC-Scp complex subunit ScpB [Oscillospiraceae bacterium]|nr:SMC-Scp complex subunit ScpB [Oscillospiraceae bacterium]
MKLDFECAAMEAVLFAAGEPLETARLAEVLETDRKTVQETAERLAAFLTESGSALQLLTLGDCYQLSTAAVHAETVRRALEVKRNTPLSNAAMEVLTIIAYNQPVTKGFVERVRGVDSSSVVNTLTERGLLEEAGRIEVPGRPVTYRTTAQFLRCFGLSSLDDLPQLPSNAETDPFTVQSAEDELTPEDSDETPPEENLETIEQEDSAEPAPAEE